MKQVKFFDAVDESRINEFLEKKYGNIDDIQFSQGRVMIVYTSDKVVQC